ncbi:MAG TPA: adenosylcobinamide-phosphate synthase CbiB [Alphaproteobacteria bacterium]|nr:adenosylcobinamide-phosphate synthase CbiB [Alphaproteobacteria bacterium]
MLFADPSIDPLLVLLAALALDAAAGEMRFVFRRVPHPVAALGRLIEWLEARLNRPQRPPATRRWRGVLTIALAAGLAVAVGLAIAGLARALPFGWAIEVFCVAVLIAQRSLYTHVAAVLRELERGGVAGGREAIRHIVGRDPESLDEHGVARAAIESLAENFADGVVAPAFWYLVAGLPGIFAAKAVNTLDSMIGHMTPRHREFGWAAARLDTALNFVPARIAGVLIALAAVVTPLAQPSGAFETMRRDARLHRSVNAGWPESAMAGALGLALAGPRRYADRFVDDPWIGDGRKEATGFDIGRALLLFVFACLVHAIALAVLRLFV